MHGYCRPSSCVRPSGRRPRETTPRSREAKGRPRLEPRPAWPSPPATSDLRGPTSREHADLTRSAPSLLTDEHAWVTHGLSSYGMLSSPQKVPSSPFLKKVLPLCPEAATLLISIATYLFSLVYMTVKTESQVCTPWAWLLSLSVMFCSWHSSSHSFLLLSMSPLHVNATVSGVSYWWAFGPFPLFAIRSKAAIIIPAEDFFLWTCVFFLE